MLSKTVKTLAAIAMAAGVLGSLSACGTANQTSYARMCENKATHERAADLSCSSASDDDSAASSYLWYYVIMTSNYSAPAVGSQLFRGTTAEPEDGEEIEENIPEGGGEISDDEAGVTEEQAPEEDNDGTSVNEDDGDNDGTSVSDDDGSDDDISGFSADDDE